MAIRQPSVDARLDGHGRAELVAGADGSSYDPLELAYDTMDGLTRPFKELSSRFLYDERGAEIFERILGLPEYYQTRTEITLLEEHGERLLTGYGARELIDLGSGSGEKSELLLGRLPSDALPAYVPVDASVEMLRDCAARMRLRFPTLEVRPLAGDFDRLEELLGPPEPGDPRFVAMFGGTLGNLAPGTRRRFLSSLGDLAGAEGSVLIGVDVLKDPRTLEWAYDDADGVTAEFNLNILRTMNDRLGADFDLDAFDHLVVFDAANSWIEMRLRARRAMRVEFAALDWSVEFAAGEEIRTEISAKFSRETFEREAGWAGLRIKEWIADAEERFAIPILGRTAT